MDKTAEQLVQEEFAKSYRSISVQGIVNSSCSGNQLLDPKALVAQLINEIGNANVKAITQILKTMETK